MAGNPILAEVSDKFGASMIRMPVGSRSILECAAGSIQASVNFWGMIWQASQYILAHESLVLRLQAKYSSLKQYAIPSLILGNAEILFFENPIGAFFLNGHALKLLMNARANHPDWERN